MKRKRLLIFGKILCVDWSGYLLGTLLVISGLLYARAVSATIVYMDTASKQSLGVAFSIDIRVDAASDIYGTAFDLIYDPEFIDVVDADIEADGVQPEVNEGGLLSNAGADTTFLLSSLEDESPGTVVVGISRAGDMGGVDALSDTVVLTVTFLPKKLGATSIIFGNPGVKDPDNGDIDVASWDGATITIIALSPGDFDGSKTVDLQDAILACQIVSRIIPAIPVYKEGDIDGDGKIGTADAIFVLQSVAELR